MPVKVIAASDALVVVVEDLDIVIDSDDTADFVNLDMAIAFIAAAIVIEADITEDASIVLVTADTVVILVEVLSSRKGFDTLCDRLLLNS